MYAAGMYFIYLRSIPRYSIFNFGYLIIRTLYLPEEGCEDLWLFFETERDQLAKKGFGNIALKEGM